MSTAQPLVLSHAQREDLAELQRGPIRIYQPSQRTIDRFGPLYRAGYIISDDVGSDEAQETIFRLSITEAGRLALDGSERCG